MTASAVLWSDVFRKVEKLAQLHAPATGCPSLDTLHVATALVRSAVDFVTFDIHESAW